MLEKAILIVDGGNDKARNCFNRFVQPKLSPDLLIEVKDCWQEAYTALQTHSYKLVIVETIVQTLKSKASYVSDEEANKIEKLLSSNEAGADSIHIEGFTGESVDSIIRQAVEFLPEIIQLAPQSRFIIVCHGKGVGLSKEDRRYLNSLDRVVAVCGWLSTAKHAKTVLRHVRKLCGREAAIG